MSELDSGSGAFQCTWRDLDVSDDQMLITMRYVYYRSSFFLPSQRTNQQRIKTREIHGEYL